jgi:hypothetical protein
VLLKINGQRVPYTLEKEARLSEVVQGVSDWLGGSGLLVTGISMGESDLLTAPREGWESTALDAVPELDFQVRRTGDLRIEHWQTLTVWLEMLEQEVKAPGPGLEELLAGLDQTLADAVHNPFEKPGAPTTDRLAAAFNGQSSAQVRRWPVERRNESVALIAEMRAKLAARIREASRPQEALTTCVEGLRASTAQLSEVPVALATGHDRQAMESIVGIADLIETLIALVPFLPPDPERGRLFGELNGVFRDLIAAFDAKDTVLIGDLIEYEAAPRIGALVPLLERHAT